MTAIRKALLSIAYFVLFAQAVGGTPITWILGAWAPTLQFPFLSRDIEGTFTYDAATNTMSSWYFKQCATFQDCRTLEPMFPPTPSCPTCVSKFIYSAHGGQYSYTFFSSEFMHHGVATQLTLAVPMPLTDAGGRMELIPGDGIGGGSYFAGGPGPLQIFPFVSGIVQPIPEPGFALGIALTLAAVAAYRTRRRV